MFSTHCAVASSPAPYCSRPGTSSKFAAPQALTLCATSARRAHVFSARVAPAVVLLHARGAIHDEVRRHATTLHSTISITVLGIAVLLIRCACCLVWIPFVVRAVVTSRAASFSLSRSGIRLSRRDMIAAAGDDASLLALSRRALIAALFAALFAFPRTFSPLPPLFSLFLEGEKD